MKAYTDDSQSRVLSNFLPPESADMYYHCCYDGTYNLSLPTNGEFKNKQFFKEYPNEIPAWSLAALMSVLPKVHGLKPVIDLEECSIQYSGIDIYITASNLIDACVETILKLHELNIL